jgi:hypothetical protein
VKKRVLINIFASLSSNLKIGLIILPVKVCEVSLPVSLDSNIVRAHVSSFIIQWKNTITIAIENALSCIVFPNKGISIPTRRIIK